MSPVLALLLVGCDGAATSGAGGAFDIAQYFDGAEAWTWRDDGDTGDVDDATVLRAERDADDVITVKRGARFANGDKMGTFTFDLGATDLVLGAWTWDGEGDLDATILAREGALPGDIVTNLKGSCVADSVTDLVTHYGTFDYALRSVCEGTPAPAGTYWFAKGFGLVKADTDRFTLDLVAPR